MSNTRKTAVNVAPVNDAAVARTYRKLRSFVVPMLSRVRVGQPSVQRSDIDYQPNASLKVRTVQLSMPARNTLVVLRDRVPKVLL